MIDLILYQDEKKRYSLRDDFKMRILSYHIGAPEVITNIVAIPYSNSYVDLTEVYGKPTYSQREISINVDCVERAELWHKYIEDMFNLFHGQKIKVVITSDSDYYYEGRVSIEVNDRDDNLVNRITIKILADPFKKHYFNDGDEKL